MLMLADYTSDTGKGTAMKMMPGTHRQRPIPEEISCFINNEIMTERECSEIDFYNNYELIEQLKSITLRKTDADNSEKVKVKK